MPLFLIPFIASFKSAVGAALTFISKPPGSWVAAAIAACLGLWWFGQHEFNSGKSACETAHAEAAANELARQKTVYITVEKRAEARAAESEKKNTDNKKVVADVKQMAAAQPTAGDVCIDAAIADKLREQN